VDASGKLATTVSDTQIRFDGVAAPLIYVRQDQTSAIVPYTVAGKKTTQLQVRSSGVLSNSAENPAAAGSILVLYATGEGQTNPAQPRDFTGRATSVDRRNLRSVDLHLYGEQRLRRLAQSELSVDPRSTVGFRKGSRRGRLCRFP
jgi:hypothetical protein